jgi:ABC-type uncharacterized transport system involved in gliding motility auxiliary subunit
MKQKNIETYLYSTAGVAIMFVLLLAFYVVTSAAKDRIDLTAEKAFTLSPGTKKILGKLDSRVTIRFYCTQGGNAMPPSLRTYAQHIEDLLANTSRPARARSSSKNLIRSPIPTPRIPRAWTAWRARRPPLAATRFIWAWS